MITDHDSGIREALNTSGLLDTDARRFDEFGILHGFQIIDIAIIGKDLHGFEIKARKDTLVRLKRQVVFYAYVFDRLTLVTTSNHIAKSELLIPDWWGVIEAEDNGIGGVVFHERRPTGVNPATQIKMQVDLLWNAEREDILEKAGCLKGVKGRGGVKMLDRIMKNIPEDTLKGLVLHYLLRREIKQ